MPKIKLVKKVLKRVINEKIDNRIRLQFDYIAASKQLEELKIEKPRYDENKILLEKKLGELGQEKGQSQGIRNKEKIITIEKAIDDLENEIQWYEKESSRLEKKKEESFVLTKSSAKIIQYLKESLNSKEILEILSQDE